MKHNILKKVKKCHNILMKHGCYVNNFLNEHLRDNLIKPKKVLYIYTTKIILCQLQFCNL